MKVQLVLLFIWTIFSFSFSFAEPDKDLEKENDVLKTENGKLNEIVMSLLKTIDGLENRMSRLETDLSDHKKEGNHFSDEQPSMHNKTNKRSFIRRQVEGKVAFTYKNSANIYDLGHDHTLKFDTRLTDITTSYRTDTGEFKAPASGYYVFFLSSRAEKYRTCWSDIMKNGNAFATTFAESSSYHDSDSTMAIVHLNVGDLVWARNKGYHSTSCTLDDLSSFAGFLLYPD